MASIRTGPRAGGSSSGWSPKRSFSSPAPRCFWRSCIATSPSDGGDALAPAFAALRGVVDEVFGIGLDDVERARALVTETAGLSARDALHVAVMEREGIERILSFDTGFDRLDSITRIAD